jgi:hypothetical protein
MTRQAGKLHEFRDINFVGAAGFGIGDVGEPFQLGRYIRKMTVLRWREGSFAIGTN